MDQTHRLIVEELGDRIEEIFAATEEIRESIGDGKTTRQLLESIFRNTHSLKASASFNGLDDIATLAHEFENLLHALRVGKVTLNDDILYAFDQTADALFSNLNDKGSRERFNDELLARLRHLSEPEARGSKFNVELTLNAVPPDVWSALSDEEKHRLEQTLGEGSNLFLISTRFDLASFDQLFQELKLELNRNGELISTAPKVDAERPDKIDFRILYARDSDLETLSSELSQHSDVTVTEIAPQQAITRGETRDKDVSPKGSSGYSIRIELDELDRLISTTHRLFRDTVAVFDRAGSSALLDRDVNHLSASFLDLASNLVNLRMVGIDRVLQRAVRAGRSTATSLGKEIDFLVVGEELRIDKSLSDAIADPLIHLVRNAVDHGIETTEEREKAGKNVRGLICISASTVQGQTRVRVTDDGRGIDTKLVSEAAKRLGVIDKQAEVDFDQSLRLLFRSGFSTTSTVSATSGRGVGLDVVETSIEKVGGAIRVDGNPGKGAVFEIRLPVTFNLLDVVVVKEGGHRYLIDSGQVKTRRTDVSETILRLDELLGLEPSDASNQAQLQCMFEGKNADDIRTIELKVNEVVNREQVLVRNLGSHGGRWFGVAGAAEMRDGKVALLLDLPALTAGSKNL